MARLFMTRKEKEARAAQGNLMTAIDWRIKLAKEHSLYVSRREGGTGDFDVKAFTGKWNDSFVKTNKKGPYISYDEMYKAGCRFDHRVNYNAFKCYTEETIKEVVEKVSRSIPRMQKEEARVQAKEVERALEYLDG